MASNVVDPVAAALRGGPLTATGVLAALRRPARSPEVTVGLLFWTLDGLIAGGAVDEQLDRSGVRRYRLISSTPLLEDPDRAVVRPFALESEEEASSMSTFQVRDTEQPPPADEPGDVTGVRLQGSLSIATGQLSLRARVSFVATSRSTGRHPA